MIEFSEITTVVYIPLPSDWHPTERQREHMYSLKDVDEVCYDHGSFVSFSFDGHPTKKQVQKKIDIITRMVTRQISVQKRRWEDD